MPSRKKPIENLEQLLSTEAISHLREKFTPTEEDYHYLNIEYDKGTETIIQYHYDNETAELTETSSNFNKNYLDLLTSEFRISKKSIDYFIDNLIHEVDSKSKISTFIQITINRLTYLLTTIEKTGETKTFIDESKEYINDLICYIKKKYSSYKSAQDLSVPPITNKIYFKLKGLTVHTKEQATNLHNSLVVNKFLNIDSKKYFVKLFTGEQPSGKIDWLKKKGELKSFIDFLLELEKIEDCSSRKWQLTALNFTIEKNDFIAKSIKDAKKPKDDTIIKKLVLDFK
jgi:hypothetical protein